jgi:hypothetical protein
VAVGAVVEAGVVGARGAVAGVGRQVGIGPCDAKVVVEAALAVRNTVVDPTAVAGGVAGLLAESQQTAKHEHCYHSCSINNKIGDHPSFLHYLTCLHSPHV